MFLSFVPDRKLNCHLIETVYNLSLVLKFHMSVFLSQRRELQSNIDLTLRRYRRLTTINASVALTRRRSTQIDVVKRRLVKRRESREGSPPERRVLP